jgi:precorrin-6B methylase 2
VCVYVAGLTGQQTGLTEGQIKAAEIEVPQLVELLQLKPGMTIADVGAGFGAWTVRFSRWIGPAGRVYASDVGAPQLAALRESIAREKLTNVTVLEGAAGSRSTCPPGRVDVPVRGPSETGGRACLLRSVRCHLPGAGRRPASD